MSKYNKAVLFGHYLCIEDIKIECEMRDTDISHMTDKELYEQVENIGRAYRDNTNDGLDVLYQLLEVKPKG